MTMNEGTGTRTEGFSEGRLQVGLAISRELHDRLFRPAELERLRDAAELLPGWNAGSDRSPLESQVEVLVTGWGTPSLTDDVLATMPRLRAVLHAAGSVKHHLPPSFWKHRITVSSAADANAVPVAEYTLAAILWANKRILPEAARFRAARGTPAYDELDDLGNVGKRVGLVGASRIGRKVIELLRPFSVEVVVSDPYLRQTEAGRLGVRRVDLDELVATSNVVSLHAPDLPETRHLMDRRRLRAMRPGATLINTARGALVDTEALTETVVAGRLYAVLDVLEPPVPARDSPLWDHPHVLLTPHLAGSLGTELWRMGELVVSELLRLDRGEPLAHQVKSGQLSRIA